MSKFINKHALFLELMAEEVGNEVANASECFNLLLEALEPAGTLVLYAEVNFIDEDEPFTGHAWDFDTYESTQRLQECGTFNYGYTVYLPHMGLSFFAGTSACYVGTCLQHAFGGEIVIEIEFMKPGGGSVFVPLLDVPYYTVDNTLRQVLQLSGQVRECEHEKDLTDKPPFWQRPELLPQVGDLLVRIPDLFPLTAKDGVTVDMFNLYDMATAREIFLFPDADDTDDDSDMTDNTAAE